MEIAKSQGFVPCRSFQRLSRPVFPPRLSASSQEYRLLSCISTNSSFMGGLVTLDRNLWGCSSILVLHTRPLDKAKGGSMSQIALFLRFWSENRHKWSKQVQRKSENGPRTVREWSENGPRTVRDGLRMVREWSENGPRMVRDGLRMVRRWSQIG